jgi:hypothetical protein
VANLINPITWTSDEQLVLGTFSETEAKMSLAMPISDSMEDFIAWHFHDKGMFSVKRAYNLKLHFAEIP